MSKKVFSKQKFLDEEKDNPHFPDDLYERLKEDQGGWIHKADGMTEEEMDEHNWGTHDAWMVGIND